MIYKSNGFMSNNFPSNPKYFKEEVITQFLEIPCKKPDMERILDILVWPEVTDLNVIETHEGLSNEGQRLTGVKLIVEVKLKSKVTYVADEKTQSVHAAHYETLKSMFIILPKEFNGRNVCDLAKVGKINVVPYVEAVNFRMLDKRAIYQCILLFLDANLY